MEQQTTLEQLLTMIEEAVSAEKKNSERILSYFQECSQLGIEVLPLDINRSDLMCSFEDERTLRLGFSAVSAGHESFLESLLAARRENGGFQSFQDCCEKIELESVPTSFWACCIEAGAFDALEESRARLFAGYEKIVKAVRSSKAEQASNQISLFAVLPADPKVKISAPPLPEVDEWTDEELIEHEQHAIGFSFTAYLLQKAESEETEPERETAPNVAEEANNGYQEREDAGKSFEKEDEAEQPEPALSREPSQELEPSLSGVQGNGAETIPEPDVSDVQESSALGADSEDSIVASPDDDEASPLPPEEFPVEKLEGPFDEPPHPAQEYTLEANEAAEVKAAAMEPEASSGHFQQVVLQCCIETTTEQTLSRIREVCIQNPGKLELLLEFVDDGQQNTRIKAHHDYRVAASEDFIGAVEEMLGKHSIRFIPAAE